MKETKQCNTCKETKELKNFIKVPTKNGYSPKCRQCMSDGKKKEEKN